MAENTGTPAQVDQAPVDEASKAPAETPGTETPKDEVTVLKSRNAGLDAKVTSLTAAQKAAEAELVAARVKLAEYEAGKVDGDEALRAQLATAKQEAANALNEAKAARIEAKFPEAYKELGQDAAVVLGEDKLASLEARLTGAVDDGDAPTPRGNNAPRAGNRTPAKPPTIDEVERQLAGMTPPWLQPSN